MFNLHVQPREPDESEQVPGDYEEQVQVLVSFYAVHDASKTAHAVRRIVDKRRESAPALSRTAFAELCQKMVGKYGSNPLGLYTPGFLSTAADPAPSSAGAAPVARSPVGPESTFTFR